MLELIDHDGHLLLLHLYVFVLAADPDQLLLEHEGLAFDQSQSLYLVVFVAVGIFLYSQQLFILICVGLHLLYGLLALLQVVGGHINDHL